jgi:alkanesulfonate monooxygenase SsuD/methylene tetrahydromethanopterin reductase-like flavin-dependent oxidoreductase (luciferase family)
VKLSYFTLTDNPATFGAKRQDSNQLLLDTVEQAIAAEAMGYHGAWLPEHHFGGFGVCPTPNQVLAYVAAKTTRLRLAQAIVLLPCNQPLRAAEELAVLDLLSNGRAIWAVGRGYDEREYRAFEIPFSESLTRFEEEMDLVVKAWTEESFTWQGKHHVIPDPVTVLPRVVQRPHPPVYVASFSEHSMKLAAARGFNILFAPFAASMVFGTLENAVATFKEMARAAGHPNAKAACSYFTAIADNKDEMRAAKERLVFYLKGISPAFPQDMSKAPPSLRYFKEIVDRIHAMTPDQVGERSIVTGSRDDVVAQLKRVEAAGIDEVILYFSFGAYPHAKVLAMMERVAREVLPEVARQTVPA